MFLIAFVVTVGTLLLQGLSLPTVIRRLGVQDPAQAERDVQAELRLVANSTREAVEYLDARRDAWAAEWGAEPIDRGITMLKDRLRRQDAAFRQGLREDTDQADDLEGPAERSPGVPAERPGGNIARAISGIRRELLEKRREVVLRERDAGNLDEEVMRRVLLGLDAEELAMDTSAVARTRS